MRTMTAFAVAIASPAAPVQTGVSSRGARTPLTVAAAIPAGGEEDGAVGVGDGAIHEVLSSHSRWTAFDQHASDIVQ